MRLDNLVQPEPDPVKNHPILQTLLAIFSFTTLSAQEETDRSATLSLFTGLMNYQGDLNPSSFKFTHSQFSGGIIVRKPLNRFFALRAGATIGTIKAADRWNRGYLKQRNLSFTTTVKEAYLGLELTLLDFSSKRFTPYVYGGLALFHYNPWTLDRQGVKTYLKPLSTEGQGLPQYPEQHPYRLTDIAIPFGGGMKFAVSDGLALGIEFSQRKSFTDYLDDVSSHYVDRSILQQAKGSKAVELSFREPEVPNGRTLYPAHGEKRGTPSEMDWYYFFGITMEFKLQALGGLLHQRAVASQRCPTRF